MKTALVTGASRGIGRAIALELAKKGLNIVLNYKENEGAAEATEKEILSCGAACLKVRCDIRNVSEVKSMRDTVKKTFGFADILVNNAGVAKGDLLQDTSEDDYDIIMDTNLKGMYNVTKLFAPKMISKGWGRIINISSIWGIEGAANESIYSASKAGVIGFTKALAKEFAPSGITVNCIAPGAIMTDMIKLLPKQTIEWLEKEIPLGGIGKGEDIAVMAAHLADEKSGYMTGQIINISGGFIL